MQTFTYLKKSLAPSIEQDVILLQKDVFQHIFDLRVSSLANRKFSGYSIFSLETVMQANIWGTVLAKLQVSSFKNAKE